MNRRLLPIAPCLVALLSAGCLLADDLAPEARPKSVTVFPVLITPSENIPPTFPQRVAEVVGMLLERAGMADVQLGQATFTPPDTDDLAEVAAAFAEFVKHQSLQSDYALFGQIFGTPQIGPQAVRAIVVDKAGNIVFTDHAGLDDLAKATPKPDCPMTTSIFLVNRVRPVWNLTDPLRADAPHGKLEAAFTKKSGTPSAADLAAMNERLAAFRKTAATTDVTVYPVHLWPGWDKAGAKGLADLLNQQHLCHATVANVAPDFTLQGDPNEQKVLWSAAHSFSQFLRKHPPETPYALLVDYGLGVAADGQHKANHVHLIVCNRAGDLVLVDYQNSHHSDFQEVDPKSIADCNRLAAIRLKARLSQ